MCTRKGLLGFIRTFFCWQRKVKEVIGRVKQTNGKLHFLTLVFWSILALFCVLFGEESKVKTWSREKSFWIIFEESTVDWIKVCWVTCFLIDCSEKSWLRRKSFGEKVIGKVESKFRGGKNIQGESKPKERVTIQSLIIHKKNHRRFFNKNLSFSLEKLTEWKKELNWVVGVVRPAVVLVCWWSKFLLIFPAIKKPLKFSWKIDFRPENLFSFRTSQLQASEPI